MKLILITTKALFLPQLKLIAKTFELNLNNKDEYLVAVRILEGRGAAFN